jgi:hypothetical protein
VKAEAMRSHGAASSWRPWRSRVQPSMTPARASPPARLTFRGPWSRKADRRSPGAQSAGPSPAASRSKRHALPFTQRGHRCLIALRTRYIKPKEWPRAVGVPWDFSGTSGCINGYERETAESPFLQVIDPRPPIAAGHGVRWSLPGHLTSSTQ